MPVALYQRGIAPLIITLGGDGGDQFSEGGVGRDYLMGAGIPESAIIAETESRSTAEAARRLDGDCAHQWLPPHCRGER